MNKSNITNSIKYVFIIVFLWLLLHSALSVIVNKIDVILMPTQVSLYNNPIQKNSATPTPRKIVFPVSKPSTFPVPTFTNIPQTNFEYFLTTHEFKKMAPSKNSSAIVFRNECGVGASFDNGQDKGMLSFSLHSVKDPTCLKLFWEGLLIFSDNDFKIVEWVSDQVTNHTEYILDGDNPTKVIGSKKVVIRYDLVSDSVTVFVER